MTRAIFWLFVLLALILDYDRPVGPRQETFAPCMELDCCEHNPDTCNDPNLYPQED